MAVRTRTPNRKREPVTARSRRRRAASGSAAARGVGLLRRLWDLLPGILRHLIRWLADLALEVLRRLGAHLETPEPAPPRRVVRVAVA